MQKKILFITDGYPSEKTNKCVFVRNIICEIAKKGVECTVIAPRIRILGNIKEKLPYYAEEKLGDNVTVKIYRPWYTHLSSNRQFMKLSMDNHFRAVLRTIKKEKLHPDYVYGHFIYNCGLTAARVGQKLHIPSYCAVGENSDRLEMNSEPYFTGLRYGNWKSILSSLSGIISVSPYNAQLLVNNGFAGEDSRIAVIPNGVSHDRFYPVDRKSARENLGLPEEKFIVAFTGAFSERKGIAELCRAIDLCEDVYSVFMGGGECKPDCRNILWSGSVPNAMLKDYLSAADVFALPTKAEGCCNAILEAMACGLPVISSDRPFNDGILNEENSIRVDCGDAQAIADAIMRLKDDSGLRKKLADGAFETVKYLTNEARSEKILDFMGIKYD